MTMTNPNTTAPTEPLVVTESTVYALSMPKYIYVQVKGVDKPLRLRGDKVEQKGNRWSLMNGQNQVGEFAMDSVQGWWIQDEQDGPAFA